MAATVALAAVSAAAADVFTGFYVAVAKTHRQGHYAGHNKSYKYRANHERNLLFLRSRGGSLGSLDVGIGPEQQVQHHCQQDHRSDEPHHVGIAGE